MHPAKHDPGVLPQCRRAASTARAFVPLNLGTAAVMHLEDLQLEIIPEKILSVRSGLQQVCVII